MVTYSLFIIVVNGLPTERIHTSTAKALREMTYRIGVRMLLVHTGELHVLVTIEKLRGVGKIQEAHGLNRLPGVQTLQVHSRKYTGPLKSYIFGVVCEALLRNSPRCLLDAVRTFIAKRWCPLLHLELARLVQESWCHSSRSSHHLNIKYEIWIP